MFRNILTVNDKYRLRDCENLLSPIQMQLSLKPKTSFHFLNLHQILKILKKKMIITATLFRELQTVKDLVRPLSEETVSGDALRVNMLKEAKLF